MYLNLTQQESEGTTYVTSKETMENTTSKPSIFDPKSFLESLFNSREAEIEVLLHNSTSHFQNITR